MPSIGATRARARWEAWVRMTTLRLRRHGVRLHVEAAGTPHLLRPPSIELTPQWFAAPPRGETGRLTLRLGENVHLGGGLVLEIRADGDNLLEIGSGVIVQGNVRLQLFDGTIRLGDESRVRDGAVVRCYGTVEVGARGGINNHTMVHCANRVVLGRGTHLAERCSALDSDHVHDGSDTWMMDQPIRIGEVLIDDNVLVGAGSVVLRDAHIGRNSLVAANALVRGGEYPPSSLLAGSPARVVRSLLAEEATA